MTGTVPAENLSTSDSRRSVVQHALTTFCRKKIEKNDKIRDIKEDKPQHSMACYSCLIPPVKE